MTAKVCPREPTRVQITVTRFSQFDATVSAQVVDRAGVALWKYDPRVVATGDSLLFDWPSFDASPPPVAEPVVWRWYESKWNEYRYAEAKNPHRMCEPLYATPDQPAASAQQEIAAPAPEPPCAHGHDFWPSASNLECNRCGLVRPIAPALRMDRDSLRVQCETYERGYSNDAVYKAWKRAEAERDAATRMGDYWHGGFTGQKARADAAEADNRALRKEVERVSQDRRLAIIGMQDSSRRAEAAEARRAELEADAARYRWLREADEPGLAFRFGITDNELNFAAIDAAIDAAINKEPAK